MKGSNICGDRFQQIPDPDDIVYGGTRNSVVAGDKDIDRIFSDIKTNSRHHHLFLGLRYTDIGEGVKDFGEERGLCGWKIRLMLNIKSVLMLQRLHMVGKSQGVYDYPGLLGEILGGRLCGTGEGSAWLSSFRSSCRGSRRFHVGNHIGSSS